MRKRLGRWTPAREGTATLRDELAQQGERLGVELPFLGGWRAPSAGPGLTERVTRGPEERERGYNRSTRPSCFRPSRRSSRERSREKVSRTVRSVAGYKRSREAARGILAPRRWFAPCAAVDISSGRTAPTVVVAGNA